jgi:hypothetical protein
MSMLRPTRKLWKRGKIMVGFLVLVINRLKKILTKSADDDYAPNRFDR